MEEGGILVYYSLPKNFEVRSFVRFSIFQFIFLFLFKCFQLFMIYGVLLDSFDYLIAYRATATHRAESPFIFIIRLVSQSLQRFFNFEVCKFYFDVFNANWTVQIGLLRYGNNCSRYVDIKSKVVIQWDGQRNKVQKDQLDK